MSHELERLIFAVHVEQQNARHKAQALTVSDLLVEQRVGLEQIE